MSEEPRYLVRNREMISRLMGIQELRLVVKTQLFDGTVVAASLSPHPPHRVAPYDVCVMMQAICSNPHYPWQYHAQSSQDYSLHRHHGFDYFFIHVRNFCLQVSQLT